MPTIKSLEEANKCSAVRLTDVRKRAKVGDLFRLSPHQGTVLWGRLIKRGHFFGMEFNLNLVYIYDVLSETMPSLDRMSPSNLLLPPKVVNNLGWSRGYWEIMAQVPLEPKDILNRHLFKRLWGTGNPQDYDVVTEGGHKVTDALLDARPLGQSGVSNYNDVDWTVREILVSRGLIPSEK